MDFNAAVAYLCAEEWEQGGHGTRLREDVLQALLPASRTEDGRLALGASPGAIEAIVGVLRNPLVFLEPEGLLAARLLRNLCARSTPNQHRAALTGAHTLVMDCIERRIAACDALEGDTPTARVPAAVRRIEGADAAVSHGRLRLPFFSAAVEFLCNFATCNAANANLVWDHAFPDLFLSILECDSSAVAAAGTALLHNCIAANPARATELVSLWNEDGSRGGRSITQSLMRRLHRDAVRSEERERSGGAAGANGGVPEIADDACGDNQVDSAAAVDDNDDDDETITWAFMVIRRLVSAGLAEEIFNVVGPSLDDIVESRPSKPLPFSAFQSTLLGVLEAALNESAETIGREDGFKFSVPDKTLPFFASLLTVSWNKHDGTVFRLGCSIVGSLILLLSGDTPGLEKMKRSAVAEAVNFLVSLHHNSQKRSAPSPSASELSGPEGGLRAAAIRLVALASDRDRIVQDLVRDMHGIVPVLSALSYEDIPEKNPFLREWAVLAVRNLCCGNEENAAAISELELLDVKASSKFLDDAGLEAFMDSSGKPRIRVKQ